MQQFSINGQPIRPQTQPQVISRTAILILSGVLIGATLSQGNLAGVSFYAFIAGILGLISFVGLDLVAQKQRKHVVRQALLAADSNLTGRLRRHIGSQIAPAPRRSQIARRVEASYLPVTPG